jgi:hypothetical protein
MGQEYHSKKVVGMVKRPKKLYTQAKKLGASSKAV